MLIHLQTNGDLNIDCPYSYVTRGAHDLETMQFPRPPTPRRLDSGWVVETVSTSKFYAVIALEQIRK